MKKLLALCLTVMLVVAMVPVFAVSAADEAAFVVSAVEGYAGDEVNVTVSTANNPGIVSLKVKVEYDADVLELTAFKNNTDAFPGTSNSKKTANPFIINWVDTLNPVNTASDVITTLTFKIKDGAAVGKSDIILKYDQADVYGQDIDPDEGPQGPEYDVAFAIVNGSVNVLCKHAETEVSKEAVAPDCTNAGSTEEVSCKACGEVLTESKEIKALGHTEVTEGAKDATCTEAGSTGTTKCSVCNEIIKEAAEIEALGHTEGEAVKENIVGDICVEAGSYDEVVYCTVCNEELSRENKEVEAIGHTEVSVNASPATCTEEGYTGDKYCSVCDKELAKGEKIAALGHKYVDGKCELCGEAEAKEETPADKDENKPTTDDKKPATDDKKPATEDKGNVDTSDKSAPTSDVANIYVVFAMLIAAAIASVVVLKKKA